MLRVILGESWIPSIHLGTIVDRVVQYAGSQFKPIPDKYPILSFASFLKPHPIVAVILISLFLRVLTGFGGYSGQGKPPMHGDYEAQRHWMEITTNLSPSEWYRNTTSNDL